MANYHDFSDDLYLNYLVNKSIRINFDKRSPYQYTNLKEFKTLVDNGRERNDQYARNLQDLNDEDLDLEDSQHLVIVKKSANVRQSPNTKSQKLATVKMHDTYPVLAKSDKDIIVVNDEEIVAHWYQIVLKNGNKGWVFGSLVKVY